MSMVTIVPTGTANVASIEAAFRRLGRPTNVTDDRAAVADAGLLVVPGVGTFGAAIRQIETADLGELLAKRIANDRPTLAICVGLQVLCETSAESPGAVGLGAVDRDVAPLSEDVRVPQLGWNEVSVPDGARFLQPGWAYFANSFRIASPPDGWTVATADHGGPFVAAIERGSVLGCQFHPELSGLWGSQLLGRWADQTTGGA